jgi:hypothetical protein
MLRARLLIIAAIFLVQLAEASGAERKTLQPGVKEVQVPFQSLKPSVTFKIGKTADRVLVTDDAVWVGGSKPYSVQRIDPSTNKIVAKIKRPGEACSGLAFGFGSIWVPVCGKSPSLARVDVNTNEISAILPLGTAGAEFQESRPAATAFGSFQTIRARSLASTPDPTLCASASQFHPVHTIRSSATA